MITMASMSYGSKPCLCRVGEQVGKVTAAEVTDNNDGRGVSLLACLGIAKMKFPGFASGKQTYGNLDLLHQITLK